MNPEHGSQPVPDPSTPSAPAPPGPVDEPLGEFLRDPGPAAAELLDKIIHGLVGGAIDAWPVTAPFAAAAGTAALLGWRRMVGRRDARLTRDARQVTVLAPPVVNPAGGEALWANLVGLLRPAWRRVVSGQPHLACEYVFTHTGVTIRFWVPGCVPLGLVERAVEAAWPGAHTRTEPAQAPLPLPRPGERGVVTGGELRLDRPEALPLRTRFDSDPVRALIGAAAGLGRDEYACVQILARPVTGRRVARSRRSAAHLRRAGGRSVFAAVGSELLDVLTPGPLHTRTGAGAATPRQSGRDPQDALELSAQRRAVVDKQRGAQYETVLRYAVARHLPADDPSPATIDAAENADDAPDAGGNDNDGNDNGGNDGGARRARDAVRGRAHALAAAFATYSEHNRYRRRRLRHPARILATRRLRRGDVVSVGELAAIAHLPTDEHVPGLIRAGARAVAPPPGIAAPGPDAKPLGVTDTGHRRPVALRVVDARHHVHVLGATGSGKSTLLARMVLADADAGRGIVLVDPKGDLVTDVLARLPRRFADRVVLIDADSRGRQPCLNPLDIRAGNAAAGAGGASVDLTVDNLVSVFRRVYAAFWGPRTDDVMRAACLTLTTQHATPSLTQLPALLADPATRARLTAGITDPVLRGFWEWFEQLSDPARAQVVAPLLNKLRAFLLRPFVRAAIAAGPSTVDMTGVLDGGICLVRIPKGSLGEETTRLVGSLTVAATWHAITGRARVPQRLRRDASLVIDECHNFLNLPYPIEDMLAEARGFRVSMTLAHQHLGQLPRELREGLSTNARSKIFFNAGPEDARDLARHTAPHLSDHDLTHLGAYHAAARLVLHGEQAPAFTLRTQPLRSATRGRAREIRAAARHADAQRRSQHPARPNAAASPSSRHGPRAVDPRRRG